MPLCGFSLLLLTLVVVVVVISFNQQFFAKFYYCRIVYDCRLALTFNSISFILARNVVADITIAMCVYIYVCIYLYLYVFMCVFGLLWRQSRAFAHF